MRFHLDAKAGPAVPAPDRTLQDIQAQLTAQQQLWAEQLARDPATFAHLEPQVHHAFQQFADRLVASLLAHAAAQQALDQAAKKK